jgi:hypothetical protein
MLGVMPQVTKCLGTSFNKVRESLDGSREQFGQVQKHQKGHSMLRTRYYTAGNGLKYAGSDATGD